VVLGDRGVGKTSIVKRYKEGVFRSDVQSTVAASFVSKSITIKGKRYRLQIWDTAGQERFRSMAPMYYRGAHAAVVVVDISQAESLLQARHWAKKLKDQSGDIRPVIAIAANKCDIGEDVRRVSREEVALLADSVDGLLIETSAKTGAGIEELFAELLRAVDLQAVETSSRKQRCASESKTTRVAADDTGQQRQRCSC